MHPWFCCLTIQGASSIEHTMNIYSDTRGCTCTQCNLAGSALVDSQVYNFIQYKSIVRGMCTWYPLNKGFSLDREVFHEPGDHGGSWKFHIIISETRNKLKSHRSTPKGMAWSPSGLRLPRYETASPMNSEWLRTTSNSGGCCGPGMVWTVSVLPAPVDCYGFQVTSVLNVEMSFNFLFR